MRRLGVLVMLAAGCTADVAGIEGRDKPDKESDDKTEQPGQTTLTLSEYFDEIAGIHCEQAFMCRAAFPPDAGYTFESAWGNSVTECEQLLIAGWDPAEVETEIAKGRITYDGTAAVTCLEGVTFAACTEYWSRGIEWAESCYHVVVGQVPVGGACANDYACTTFYCEQTTYTCQ